MPTYFQTLEPFQIPSYYGLTILVDPGKLRRYFGDPLPGVAPESSGEYYFVSDHSLNTFRLYEWKQTSLWSSELVDPLLFWRASEQVLLRLDCVSQKSLADEGWDLGDTLERTCGADLSVVSQSEGRSLGRGRVKVVYKKELPT